MARLRSPISAVAATVGALVLTMLLAGASAEAAPSNSGTPTPGGPHLRADGHISLAWLYGGTSADYRAQIEQMQGLTVISPTWWYLDSDDPGALELSTDDELVAWSQARGLTVWPLLGNHIDPDLTDQVLRDPALRQRLVDATVAEVRRSGVDGVNVDFENLHDDTRFPLTDLVAELKAALPDLVVSVDVTAMTDTWVLGNWSTAFDREGLGEVADYVMLMAYDQHNSLRRDGPVAGLQWVAESTEFLLRTVPAHKVVLGLPLYSRDWAEDPSARDGIDLDATMGMAAMGARMTERSQSVVFDPVAGQDLHSYVDAEGRTHRVWLEDVASLQRKTELVPQHGLAGIAAWRAGFEPPEVWTALDAQLAAVPRPGVSPPAQDRPVAVTQPPGPSPDPQVEVQPRDPAADPTVPPSPAVGSPTAQPIDEVPTQDTRAPLMGVAAGLLLVVTSGGWLVARRGGG